MIASEIIILVCIISFSAYYILNSLDRVSILYVLDCIEHIKELGEKVENVAKLSSDAFLIINSRLIDITNSIYNTKDDVIDMDMKSIKKSAELMIDRQIAVSASEMADTYATITHKLTNKLDRMNTFQRVIWYVFQPKDTDRFIYKKYRKLNKYTKSLRYIRDKYEPSIKNWEELSKQEEKSQKKLKEAGKKALEKIRSLRK